MKTTIYNKDNLRILRRYFNLTQKQFIEQFLLDETGAPSMSVATYSNIEAKGGKRTSEIVLSVAEKLSVDAMVFAMESEEFAEKQSLLFPGKAEAIEAEFGDNTKKNISQLVNRLTLYFSEQMLSQELKKGDKIESDRVLAIKLEVGRSAIREALKVLDVMGMIDIRPGQGTYISSDESNFFIIPLSWSLFLNGNQIEDILEVRNQMQVSAAELAASNRESGFLDELNKITHTIHAAYRKLDYKVCLEGDVDFHLCIAKGSKNLVLYSMTLTISNLMRHVSGTGMVEEKQLKEIYEEHSKIYQSILAGDGKGAAEAMKYHLSKSKERYNYR